MPDELITSATAIAAGGWVSAKLFGGMLTTIGDDINKAYQKGRDKILDAATKKVPNPEDGKIPNLRASRDILWSGAITDDEVCAEYFGGMLAGARSLDGKDDSVIHYVDTVKSLSAKQLELHYVIYASWQNMLLAEPQPLNFAQGKDVISKELYFSGFELFSRGLRYDFDLTVLSREGLINNFKYDKEQTGETLKLYVMVRPSVFGIMLFAVAHNKLNQWLKYGEEKYQSTSGIAAAKLVSSTLAGLPSHELKGVKEG